MKRMLVILGFILTGCDSDEVKRDRFFLQGNIALDERSYDQAIDFYTKAINMDNTFARAFNNRGVAYMEDDHPYEAIQDYNMAISLDPEYYDAVFNRAYAYEQVGRLDDALSDVQSVKQVFPDSAYVYFYQGLLESKNMDYQASMTSFRQAKKLDPTNAETDINIATLYYFQNHTDSAKALLKKVLQKQPNQPSALNTLSQVYLSEQDFQNALTTINRALKLVPNEPYFLNNRGQIYLEMDSLDRGADDINKSILQDPKNNWAYRNKGIYFLKSGDPEQALRLFQRVIEAPEFVDEIYTYKGEAHMMLDDLTAACASWTTGMERNEKRSKALFQQYCQ